MRPERLGQEGWRERKRQETFRRISEAGLKLFIANGFEATTLDDIAEASNISRRTFFYYFKSKEDILLAWQSGLSDVFRAALLAEPIGQPPLAAVRNAHLKMVAHYNTDQAILVDRILRSSDQLRVSNQAKYLQLEQATFEALCEFRPQARRKVLRMVAMMSIGALRLAIDMWAEMEGRRPLTKCLTETFADLETALADA